VSIVNGPGAAVPPVRFWKPVADESYARRLDDFANEHVAPVAARIDSEDIYPIEIVRALAEAGFTRSMLAPEYGGAGDFRTTIALFEGLGYHSVSVAVSLISIFQAQTMLRLFGSKELQDIYIPQLAAGMPASYSLTEERHGSDIRKLDTKAKRDPNGDWILNGEKSFITSGDGAEFFVLLAETEQGVSAFAVPFKEGCEKYVGTHSATMGLRNGPHVNMRLTDLRLPANHLIGTEGKGVRQAAMTLSFSRTCTAGMMTGVARAAFDGALHRAYGRTAFDQRILDFQGIQWYFAEMFCDIEASRLLTYRAAEALNADDDVDRYSSVAKLRACRTATEVALQAMQICGAYGTSDNTPFARYLRDAKTYEIGAGSAEIMKNTIAKYIIRGIAE
jgi:alkylation response protein AidB-like acyl-CoA dehydrogenase